MGGAGGRDGNLLALAGRVCVLENVIYFNRHTFSSARSDQLRTAPLFILATVRHHMIHSVPLITVCCHLHYR